MFYHRRHTREKGLSKTFHFSIGGKIIAGLQTFRNNAITHNWWNGYPCEPHRVQFTLRPILIGKGKHNYTNAPDETLFGCEVNFDVETAVLIVTCRARAINSEFLYCGFPKYASRSQIFASSGDSSNTDCWHSGWAAKFRLNSVGNNSNSRAPKIWHCSAFWEGPAKHSSTLVCALVQK